MKCECRETILLKNKYNVNVNDCECLFKSINYCNITVYCKVVVLDYRSASGRKSDRYVFH